MTPTEAKRLKKRLHEQYLHDVASIDRVLEISQRGTVARISDGDAIRSDSASVAASSVFGHSNPEFEDEILKVINDRLIGDFKINDVMTAVGEAKPELAGKRSTISFAVSGLARSGKLAVVQQGRGRRPGIYRRSQGTIRSLIS